MSRFNFEFDDGDAMPEGLWRHNLKRALVSTRGQKALAELEEALLALPEKKLIAGKMAWPSGAVCAIGAFALHKMLQAGEDRDDALHWLCAVEDPWETASTGKRHGMTYTLAWHIAQMNDENFANLPDDIRYTRMLAWVRRQLGKADDADAA